MTKTKRYANGLRLVVATMDSMMSVSAGILVGAGSRLETAETNGETEGEIRVVFDHNMEEDGKLSRQEPFITSAVFRMPSRHNSLLQGHVSRLTVVPEAAENHGHFAGSCWGYV